MIPERCIIVIESLESAQKIYNENRRIRELLKTKGIPDCDTFVQKIKKERIGWGQPIAMRVGDDPSGVCPVRDIRITRYSFYESKKHIMEHVHLKSQNLTKVKIQHGWVM